MFQNYQAPKTEQVNFYGACPRMMQSADPSQANGLTSTLGAPLRVVPTHKIP